MPEQAQVVLLLIATYYVVASGITIAIRIARKISATVSKRRGG